MGEVEIYGLSDESGLRYVGKANNSAKRLKRHMLDARRRRTPVYDWINSLTARGQSPIMCVLEITDQDGWAEAERRHIAEARKRGCRLLNLAEGGNAPFCSLEVRRANAVDLNRRLDADPKARQIWRWKRQIANGLNAGQIRNSTREMLRQSAKLDPSTFGAWANIPNRLEDAHGQAL